MLAKRVSLAHMARAVVGRRSSEDCGRPDRRGGAGSVSGRWAIVDCAVGECRTTVHMGAWPPARSSSRLPKHIPPSEAERGMPSRAPQIVALGGGGFSMERDGSLLDEYVLSLTGTPRARASASCRPPPATPTTTWCASTGASPPTARPATCRCSAATRAPAASRTTSPRHLLAQDLIYVGGGNVVSMLGAWRAHGLDAILRKAWREGVVLCGPSAGSLCWFDAGAQRLPRRARAPCGGWGCCPTPTACTTTPSRPGAPSTTASSPTACDRDSPSRTASRCTSARTRLERPSARAPTAAPSASSRPADACARRALDVICLGIAEPRPDGRGEDAGGHVRTGDAATKRAQRREPVAA